MRVFGTSSCIRLRQRIKVDFPQPLGPMIAVTAFDAMSSVTSLMARFSPYQSERFFTSKVNRGAVSAVERGSVGFSARSTTVGSGFAISKLTIRRKKLDDRCRSPAGQNSHQHINAKDSGDQDQGAGPSLAMPIVVGRDGVSKNLQWERGNRFTQVMVPKPVAEGSEKQRRGLAADPCQRQQNASNDSSGCCLHYDVHDRFPTSDTERESRLTIAVWHQQNHFLSRAQN